MGIVLMELVSGRIPTDGSFGVDMDMVRWVESGMEVQQGSGWEEELVDPALKPLLPREEAFGSKEKETVVSAFSTVGVVLFYKRKQESLRRRGSEVNCAYSSSSSQAQRRLLFQHGAAKRDFKWEDIMEATNNLSDEFIIGSGGSGMIYKAELPTGETVAVKKILRKDDILLDKSFTREIKTLGRIKHRHLMKLIGCCSNKAGGTNLLIYEYMEN